MSRTDSSRSLKGLASSSVPIFTDEISDGFHIAIRHDTLRVPPCLRTAHAVFWHDLHKIWPSNFSLFIRQKNTTFPSTAAPHLAHVPFFSTA